MTSTIICFFTLKFWIGTSRKGDEDRDWKHSTSSCRQKPLSRLIFKRRTDAANRELDVNQRWLTGQGHFRGQSDFNRGRCPSGPTPRSAPDEKHRQGSPSAISHQTWFLWSNENTFCMQRKLNNDFYLAIRLLSLSPCHHSAILDITHRTQAVYALLHQLQCKDALLKSKWKYT